MHLPPSTASRVRCLPSGHRVAVAAGSSLREAVVRAGADSLSPVTDDERDVLARLGAAPTERLACRAEVHDAVAVTTTDW